MFGSPENWSAMIEQLSADSAVRDRIQLLTFRYDSLQPIPDSGRALLAALAEAQRRLDSEGKDVAFDRVVLVGHSMGGLVAKAAVLAPTPPPRVAADLSLGGIERASAPRVSRLIFIATPHRGSPVDRGALRSAGNWLARGLSPLHEGQATSVDQLTWDNPVLAALERTRAAEGVPFHSIIATLRDPSAEGATDGLVPVASARLDGARSEVVVRTHHLCFQHPEVIREVRRVLSEHATPPTSTSQGERSMGGGAPPGRSGATNAGIRRQGDTRPGS
jgi:pimeloyl-ACP methyl ester carboxylesterase